MGRAIRYLSIFFFTRRLKLNDILFSIISQLSPILKFVCNCYVM